ncbi:hypothetical protein IMSAG249_00276 [Lachnospiraceae bacterium]|nr:hypothetical protein IMSAG249_00276 [Lachnospiraceae bacterium]
MEYQIPLKSDQILYAITLDLEYYAISGYDSPCVVAYSYNVRTAEGTVIQSDSIGGTNTGTVANFGTVTKNILIDLLQRPFSTGHEYLVLTIEYSMDGQVTNSQNQMCQAKIGFTNIEARYK